MDQSVYQKVLNLAYFFLRFRARTEYEMIQYLKNKLKNTPDNDSVIVTVIEQLKSEDLINDEKFIRMYVNDKVRFKSRSIFMLKKELARLGIHQDLVSNYFSSSSIDDLSTAVTLLTKKKGLFRGLDPKRKYQKAISYLMSKGYMFDTAKRAYYRAFENQNL